MQRTLIHSLSCTKGDELMDRKYLNYFLTMLKQNRLLLAAWLASGVLIAGLLWIYQQPIEPALLYMLITLCVLIVWCGFYLGRLHRINHLLRAEDFDSALYPPQLEACVVKLDQLKESMVHQSTQEKKLRTDMQDYFSLWAHQIKLPLAAMNLQLELPEIERENLLRETSRIDSCVTLAMAYIRMEGSDYQISWYDLESIVRPILRDNSTTFIRRHIQLRTAFGSDKVCTDQKWTAFIIEQLLSNAFKYAPDHSIIEIETRKDQFILRDEGPGIDPADLPRVFERGFTGQNGRTQMHASSGLGLFLVKGICDQLSISIELKNRMTPLAPSEDDWDEEIEPVQNSPAQDSSSVFSSDPALNRDSDKDGKASPKVYGLDVILTFPTSAWLND